ncbi:MAG: hypothetical protein MI673_05755 [Thiotrichales bacterium]|nr:hypothetical protein [Thiotrichales bacterium]
MSDHRNIILCVLLLLGSKPSIAEDTRDPNQMTGDDWTIVNTARDSYYECLQTKMLEFSKNSDDPRVIADQVLEVCSVILLKMNRDLDELNINPHFTQRYIYNMKNKAAQQLLRNLMMLIASRHEQIDAETAENSGEIQE